MDMQLSSVGAPIIIGEGGKKKEERSKILRLEEREKENYRL
ncbi:hypothetical protein OX284_002290 [Flavobacterium sp. SUN046]|nr:hypothetical protein [Flavobacterium sp. SUN046]MEC4048245.1 hypothetical protein [Flavobacterium sp. SUN046]